MPTCSESGHAAVKFILHEIELKRIICPSEISLTLISRETGFTPQLIGMAFDDYIKKALGENGFVAKKAGKPCRLQIARK